MEAGHVFLLLETAATTFMAGVLWTMQLLNYPLLSLVGTEAFPRYEGAHNRRFALVVVPGVLAAAVGGIALVVSRPRQVPAWAPVTELALLLIVIISTAALQGRQHAALAHRFDQRTVSRLVLVQLDPRGRLVCSGCHRTVDVSAGVHAVSAQGIRPGQVQRPPRRSRSTASGRAGDAMHDQTGGSA